MLDFTLSFSNITLDDRPEKPVGRGWWRKAAEIVICREPWGIENFVHRIKDSSLNRYLQLQRECMLLWSMVETEEEEDEAGT